MKTVSQAYVLRKGKLEPNARRLIVDTFAEGDAGIETLRDFLFLEAKKFKEPVLFVTRWELKQ